MESNRAFSFAERELIGLIGLMRLLVPLFSCLLVSLVSLSACLPISTSLRHGPKAGSPAKSNQSVAQLIAQGKALYRAQRLKPALAKPEAALKLDPENDEALSPPP